jgi:hypothetical protein
MAPIEAIRREQGRGGEIQPRSGVAGTVGPVALFVIVLAIAALGEMVGERTVTVAEAPRASSWEAVLRVGDEARARGDAPAARRAYLTALFRARGERALVGVLAAAEGFKALGDRETVEHALRIAASLGAERAEGDVARRLQALRDRIEPADALPATVQPLP